MNEAIACGQDPTCVKSLQDCDLECKDTPTVTCFSTCVSKKGNPNASAYWKCILDNNCLNQFKKSTAVAVKDPQPCIDKYCKKE